MIGYPGIPGYVRFPGDEEDYNNDLLEDPRWAAFFAEHPDIADMMCKYFGVSHWINLPPFSYPCDEIPF